MDDFKIKLNYQQQQIYKIVENGENLFLTGAGGVGKSFLIKYLNETFRERGIRVDLTAMTGIAGLNIGGSTIHRWAGIGKGDSSKAEMLMMARKCTKNWKNTSILVIDEVSMLSPILMDKLDYVGRSIRRVNKPFGGIQLIFSGDFCQLPPVETDKYCFECHTWIACNFRECELTENMRQSDPVFQLLLKEIRMGIVTKKSKTILQEKLHAKLDIPHGIIPMKLFPTKKAADRVNDAEVKKISREDNKPFKYTALHYIINPNKIKTTDEREKQWVGSLQKSCPAKDSIILLKTVQVMLIQNLDPEAGLVNGSKGMVTDFEDGRPIVQFANGIIRTIKPHDWTLKINDNIEVGRRQIPLVYGYAVTIHKSQSLTIDYVDADMGRENFADGQIYTALSRVRTLEGLTISALDLSNVSCHPKVVEFYKNLTRFTLNENDRPRIEVEERNEIVEDIIIDETE
tara:strand:- start:858 stop:2231 length:1374 start_codon:yes stop_codon:yes gene_type:complete